MPQLAADFAAILQGGQPVGLAVSGGGDSMALLHLAQASGGNIHIASVNHHLRDAAAAECAMVADYCAKAGLPHVTLHWHWNGQGNLQQAARDGRYAALAAWGRECGLATIALGHTADDQAETLLMALARGAGVDGLAAMGAVTQKHGIRFDRPLLGQSRAALRDYLRAQGLIWADDPGNDDPRYERIRLRQAQDVLADLGLTPAALGQVAHQMGQAAAALTQHVDDLAAAALIRQGGDVLIGLPPDRPSTESARRLLLAAMAEVNRALTPPRRAEQHQMMQAWRDGRQITLAGCLIRPEGGALRVAREYAALRGVTAATTDIWDRRWRLTGPHDPALQIAALGDGITQCADWRLTGLPRTSLLASPAIWRGDRLVAAPLAGFGAEWRAQIVAEHDPLGFAH
jgi:tRNA(Ile)-lysidine synthase